MTEMRISTFLPTIKCSTCARDIEISQMGDHVCGGPGEPTPPPDSLGSFDKMYKQSPTNGPPFLKPLKSLPPRVDTNAANRPFLPPDQLTPVSASPSRSRSPFSSLDVKRSPNPFSKPMRSATAPIPRAPPSPDVLSSNLDCAFPPFPASKPAPAPAKPSLGSGYGGFGKKPSESNLMYAPLSPRNIGEGGLLQRMNSIAPGPFDPKAKRDEVKGHRRQATSDSMKDMVPTTNVIGNSIERPATTGPGHSRTSTTSSNGSKSGIAPPRMPRKNGYGGFGPPGAEEMEPVNSESRSQTFPLRNQAIDSPLRRPSESGNIPRSRQKSNDATSPLGQVQRAPGSSPPRQRMASLGPDLSRQLPPRGASTSRTRGDGRLGDAPSVLSNLNLAEEFGIGNPYHTSSESQSSDNSGYSEESQASSRSSPPRHSHRQASDEMKMDVLMADLESSMSELQPKQLPSNSPPRTNASEQYARAPPGPRNIDTALLSPELPMDPAIQAGRLSPIPHPRTQNTSRSLSPLRSSDPMQRPSMRRTATSSSSRPSNPKGNCKGCGEPIRGKSVSSADGRLTGRYHKQCFNCTTCSEPFQTATFYVIADAPYCERHYHKLNNSVCSTCDRGIEGQYLESERKQKFHPQCLACSDCKRVLKNDYFEMGGKVYCERDAFHRAQQNRGRGGGGFLGPGMGPGSNRMERRTTRLMMM